MKMNLFEISFCIFHVYVFGFDDVSSEIFSSEMIEDGKNQYQLLQERGKLPQYGDCWKNAVEHVHEGCRYLTEDVQSDIALRITNCFLEMSGHDPYHCDHDKKQNLRRICISSMSDRAFNVYTEFYTHAQNICWFLRGQIWQERISERTFHVGEQLKSSVRQQDLLLQQQRESLSMQAQLLSYGRSLERVLNESRLQADSVMEEIRTSTVKHQQLLSVMANSLSGLQSWLIGEISWFDSLVFYVGGAIVIIIVTSTYRTAAARLPLLFLLSTNILLERALCDRLHVQAHIHAMHDRLNQYVWWCRQLTVTIGALVVSVQAYCYRDYAACNNALLQAIQEQNAAIRRELEQLRQPAVPCGDKLRTSPFSERSIEPEVIKPVVRACYRPSQPDSVSELSKNSVSTRASELNNYTYSNRCVHGRSHVSTHREAAHSYGHGWPQEHEDDGVHMASSLRRYNLRSRQNTPVLDTTGH